MILDDIHMPRSCEECYFVRRHLSFNSYYCDLTDDRVSAMPWGWNDKPDDCPLKEVNGEEP